MIGISKLYCDTVEPSDVLRYGRHSSRLPSHLLQFSEDKRPVVILNITKRCNLKCVHCYAGSNDGLASSEMSTDELLHVIDDLADFGSPVVLFSGGEPLLHPGIVRLADHAVKSGMRAVISTNGTLITSQLAEELAQIGLSYIGISLDGTREIHDRFRGVTGAFDQTIQGLRIAANAGIKTGVRFTVTKRNVEAVPEIFDLLEQENIPRVCFYHLVYTGRGEGLLGEALSHDATRNTVEYIIDRTAALHSNGKKIEVLTVDNHCDGPYLYLRLLRENPDRAKKVLELLRFNGGNSTGVGVASIGWDGSVHPDQFWRNHILGNVQTKPFGEIWTNKHNDFLMKLKNKKQYVTGRCSQCRYLDICGGNFRARAEAVTGDLWAPDPACYLTDAEIGIE
ncbi:MAG: 12,18-didecarboxysiroheme deacetylase [Candidatus Latescibacteria bacterium]|nr:12,18-didecarboxysiroheme deacetylase [Candidatus Latescibacterota bacterium]